MHILRQLHWHFILKLGKLEKTEVIWPINSLTESGNIPSVRVQKAAWLKWTLLSGEGFLKLLCDGGPTATFAKYIQRYHLKLERTAFSSHWCRGGYTQRSWWIQMLTLHPGEPLWDSKMLFWPPPKCQLVVLRSAIGMEMKTNQIKHVPKSQNVIFNRI